MGCGSSKVDIETQLDQVRDAVVTGAGVAAFIVSGAGSAVVNGVYVRDGIQESRPCFRNGQFWLCRYGDKWFIADKDRLDEDDGDFYSCPVDDEEGLPEGHGWECCVDGREPLPKIDSVLEGPSTLVVEGAGSTQVNGAYQRAGTYDGAPKYVKDGGHLCIYRSRGNWYRWMLGDFRKVAEDEGDMYQSASASEYPPLPASNWKVSEDGIEPAPRIVALNNCGQPMSPGWVLDTAHPAHMAVAQYMAVTTTVATTVAVATPVAMPYAP